MPGGEPTKRLDATVDNETVHGFTVARGTAPACHVQGKTLRSGNPDLATRGARCDAFAGYDEVQG
eukprot:3261376-Alexandrium_andersonii.AAC.1